MTMKVVSHWVIANSDNDVKHQPEQQPRSQRRNDRAQGEGGAQQATQHYTTSHTTRKVYRLPVPKSDGSYLDSLCSGVTYINVVRPTVPCQKETESQRAKHTTMKMMIDLLIYFSYFYFVWLILVCYKTSKILCMFFLLFGCYFQIWQTTQFSRHEALRERLQSFLNGFQAYV